MNWNLWIVSRKRLNDLEIYVLNNDAPSSTVPIAEEWEREKKKKQQREWNGCRLPFSTVTAHHETFERLQHSLGESHDWTELQSIRFYYQFTEHFVRIFQPYHNYIKTEKRKWEWVLRWVRLVKIREIITRFQ